MVNQQLIDFVKNSLQHGVLKEKIINDLLSNGWTLQDIQECFISLNVDISSFIDISSIKKDSKNNSKNIIILVIILFLISTLALGKRRI